MLVLNLSCANQHHFEGWFGSAADFQSQLGRALISCPICADQQITRLPSAPHLNVSHLRAGPVKPEADDVKPKPTPASVPVPVPAERAADAQLKLLQAAVTQVLANTDDVGDRFAEEARRIHYGETKPHGIRGQASAAEVADLTDEGIAVLSLALPAALKGRLQ